MYILQQSKNLQNSFQGDILIATPVIDDSRFYRSIIYITKDDGKTVQGIILNKISNRNPNALLGEEITEKVKLMIGGPVFNNRITLMHNAKNQRESSVAVNKSIYINQSAPEILNIIKETSGKNLLLSVGLSQWTKEQLNIEIVMGGWLCAKKKGSILTESNKKPGLWEDFYMQNHITTTKEKFCMINSFIN